MKQFYFLVASLCFHFITQAQSDTSKQEQNDTIRIGKFIIIRKGGDTPNEGDTTRVRTRHRVEHPNVTTNWGIVDLGFTNYNDETNYSSAEAQQFAPGATKDWFKLRNGKSVDVNIWIFMQTVNVVKHVVNLKYGLGLELNNYRYKQDIRFQTNPTLVYKDVIKYSKNKLAADYVTVPLMVNFNFTPHNESGRSFGLSFGASGGYLYTARQKYISGETGKKKTKDEFDLRPFKLSYIAELKLGPVKFYGSLATQSMFERGLDQTPYNLGIRLAGN
jgi:hypothetical protein